MTSYIPNRKYMGFKFDDSPKWDEDRWCMMHTATLEAHIVRRGKIYIVIKGATYKDTRELIKDYLSTQDFDSQHEAIR